MSINVSGIIVFNNNHMLLKEKIEISFWLQKIANERKIGINQGGNITLYAQKNINNINNFDSIPDRNYIFELTDDPLDYNAEYIFGGYDFELDANNYDSFESRIDRVHSIFVEVLKKNNIVRIELYINVDIDDEIQCLETNILSFKDRLKDIFINEEGWTPAIKVIISK